MQGGTINQDNRHLQKVSTGAKYLEFTVHYHEHMYQAREKHNGTVHNKMFAIAQIWKQLKSII